MGTSLRWSVSVTCGCLLLSTLTAAAQTDLPCPDVFLKLGETPTAERRQQWAAYLLEPMRQLDDAVPALSPAEQSWLDDELKGSPQRQAQALDRPEGNKFVAKNFTRNFVETLE